MNNLRTFPHRGFVVEMDLVPPGLLAGLECEGLAGMAARTVDGVYFEPRASLATILQRIERSGASVQGFRTAGTPASWHESARPAATARARLTNSRSAVWLPILPPAA